jgi:Zn-dependent protease
MLYVDDFFSKIIQIFLSVIAIFFAIALHEISHGLVAYLLGDDTAKKAGRFKLHTHFDLWGSLIIPLALFLMKFPFLIGYAKPVPIDPRKFKDPTTDMAIVAVAGPACNFVLACVAAFVLKNMVGYPPVMQQLCLSFIISNLALLFFNLIPIPPLDGSRLIAVIIPKNWMSKYYSLEPFGFILLIMLETTTRLMSGFIGHNISLFYYFVETPLRGMLKYLLS